MTDAGKKTRQQPREADKGESGAGMMEDMMAHCAQMMPQMKAMCCGAPIEDEAAKDAGQKA